MHDPITYPAKVIVYKLSDKLFLKTEFRIWTDFLPARQFRGHDAFVYFF